MMPPQGSPANAGAELAERLGLVVGTHGRHCWVETDDGQRLLCHPRGKKDAPLVGDRVCWQPSGDGGTVMRTLERRNLFYRQDELRTKSFAANLDLLLVLLAADPVFSESQLNRALVAARAVGIEALVVLNKQDLGPAFDSAWARLAPYRAFGQTVLPLCLNAPGGAAGAPASLGDGGLEALRQHLQGRATLVLGPSGTGKSTLVNRLVPTAMAATGAVSRALNSGRHTTTSSTWYWLDAQRRSALIDSPGFQEFGLRHLEPPQLAHLMPDLDAHCGQCRFYNCTHLHEPGCAVRAAVGTGINEQRYRLYVDLHCELSVAARY